METTNLLLQSTRVTRTGMINPTFIEDAVIVSEKEQEKEHPNFILSRDSLNRQVRVGEVDGLSACVFHCDR